jgi:heptosyltransferase-2
MSNWNIKCRFFNDEYACETLVSEDYGGCEECKFAVPYSKKILIIKLGAMGDVLRTTPILMAIKKKYPESKIYWMIKDLYGEGKEMLKENPYIDKILLYNLDDILRIQQENFDIIFSLEITKPGTLIANLAKAKEKFGYYFKDGASFCFNDGAKEYLETAFLQNKKLKNRKTYQELIFRACELPYEKQEIIFELSEKDKKYKEYFKKEKNISEKDDILGINFGSGKRWPSKKWSEKKVMEFIEKAGDKYKIILLGGPEEKNEILMLSNELRKKSINIITNNPDNSLGEFAAVLDLCDKIITTDSLALHLSIALKKPTVSLFFCTPPWEIESYNRVVKIQSPLLKENFFSKKYSDKLSDSISSEQVLKAINSLDNDEQSKRGKISRV